MSPDRPLVFQVPEMVILGGVAAFLSYVAVCVIAPIGKAPLPVDDPATELPSRELRVLELRQERERQTRQGIFSSAVTGALVPVLLGLTDARLFLWLLPLSPVFAWVAWKNSPEARDLARHLASQPPTLTWFQILVLSTQQIFTTRGTDRLWAASPLLGIFLLALVLFVIIVRGCALAE